MIAVFCMLDLLLFYVFFESVLIPMLCGAEHLIFAARSAASAGALCSKPFRADLNWVVPAKLSEKGSLVCKHSILVELVGWPIWDWGGYSEWVPCKTSPRLLEYCMNMQKRVLLGRGKWSFAARKKFFVKSEKCRHTCANYRWRLQGWRGRALYSTPEDGRKLVSYLLSWQG